MLRVGDPPESRNITRHCCVLFLACSIFLLLSCENALANAIGLKAPITGLAIGTWSGSGNVNFDSNPFCVGSYSGDSCNEVKVDYNVMVSNRTAGSPGKFRLLNGTRSLPIAITYIDLSYIKEDPLTESKTVYTKTAKSGSKDCALNNGQVSVTLLEASLFAVPAGYYTEIMDIAFKQLGTGGATYTDTFVVSITVPQLVRISNVNDINLGSWSGVGNLSKSDDICVYDNSGGLYTATFTGSAGFTIQNTALQTLPYTVTYRDGAGLSTNVTSGSPKDFSKAHESSIECGGVGATNGTITITILEAEMAAKTAATYTGILTIMVAPR